MHCRSEKLGTDGDIHKNKIKKPAQAEPYIQSTAKGSQRGETYCSAGASALIGTIVSPDARTVMPWNRPSTTREPTGRAWNAGIPISGCT